MNVRLVALLFTIICSALSSDYWSQDTVLLMSGKEVDCKITQDLEGDLVYEVVKKNGKTKEIRINKSEVYSITYSGNEPVILYQFDEELGNWMTEEEMFIYIVGEQDARNNFKAKGVEILGYVLGTGVGYFSQGSFILMMTGPIGYTAYQFIPLIKIREEHLSDKSYAYNDFYLNGFEPVARTKRIMAALKSSFIGTAVGTILYYIIPFN